jgi:hypothetical protein
MRTWEWGREFRTSRLQGVQEDALAKVAIT